MDTSLLPLISGDSHVAEPRWRCAALIPTWDVDRAIAEVERRQIHATFQDDLSVGALSAPGARRGRGACW